MPTEQMVAVPDTSTLFMARRSDLRLVKKSIIQTRDREGQPAETIPGETVEFHDGVLRVPHEGTMQLADGRAIPADEVRAWLEQHPMLGDWQEGFWLVDPTAPPPSQDELDQLQELAMDLDVDGLERFIVQELEGWGRPALVETAEKSLEKVRVKAAENESRREAALQEARAEGAQTKE